MTDEELENLLSEFSDYTCDDLTEAFAKLVIDALACIIRLKHTIATLKNENKKLSEKLETVQKTAETVRRDTAKEIYGYIDSLPEGFRDIPMTVTLFLNKIKCYIDYTYKLSAPITES